LIGKPAKLSSLYPKDNFLASKAVDGIYIEPGVETSMAHSRPEHRPWWRVDLVDIHCVWAVNILNRANHGMSQFSFNFLIFSSFIKLINKVLKILFKLIVLFICKIKS